MEGVLLQATIYLTAMAVAVPLSVLLGLGSVLGHAGIGIGPPLGLVEAETRTATVLVVAVDDTKAAVDLECAQRDAANHGLAQA